MKNLVHKMKDEDQSPYQVLQQDTSAHIVWDRETNITAYALFEANDQLNQKHIIAADTPSMVMIKEEADAIIMSAVDPDLRLYEGMDPDQYDEHGQFAGRGGVYTRPWRFNESQMHTMTFTLHGEWSLVSEGNNYRIVSRGNGRTVIEVDSKDAVPVEFILKGS